MFKKIQLKNGLKVLLIESHKSPVLSFQVWVRTGSADEHDGQEGLSHFIEHLLFKGTSKYAVGEIAACVEGAGGELNAYTSFDQTVYHVTISKQYAETGLDVLSQMIGSPLFDLQEVNNEREVVIEEIKRGLDSPHRQASQLLFSSVYPRHPYGTPVIGFEKIIREISREKILEYFHERYVPQNMTLVVAGDFNQQDMKQKVVNYFGHLKKKKLPLRKRMQEIAQKRPKIAVQGLNFSETLVYLAWRTPKAEHKDIAALEVLAILLGQGESSRLNHALRLSEPLVNDAGSSVFAAKDPGFFAVSLALNVENLPRALDKLLTEIRRTQSELFSNEELQKAMINLNSEQFYSLETVDGMARKYGVYEDLFHDPLFLQKFIRRVNALKPKDILACARKYLQPKFLTVATTTSPEQAHIQDKIERWLKEYQGQARSTPRPKVHMRQGQRAVRVQWFPKVKRNRVGPKKMTLECGTTLILRPNYDTPVVSVRCAMLGGSRTEPAKEAGATELLARCWSSGAGPFSEADLHAKVDSRAASLTAFGGRNTIGLNMTSLRPFHEEILQLLLYVLREPKFSESAIAREKIAMQELLKNRRDNPAQVAILRFMQTLFSGHPYGQDPLGDEQTVSLLNRESIFRRWQQTCGQKNLVFAVAGHFDEKVLVRQLKKELHTLAKGQKELKRVNYLPPKAEQRVFEASKKEQTHIVYGFSGLTLTDPDRYVLQVLQSILAGQGGRLFYELRDKASLAYSVSPLRMDGLDAGYFGAYIGCSPEKGSKSIEMLRAEFHKLVDKRVSDDELLRAKRYLIGRHDIDLQKNSSVATSMLFDEIYGIDYREAFHYAERIDDISAADIQRVAKRIFTQPEVMSVVGPREPWA